MFLILTFISIISILSDAISAVPLGHSIKVAPRVTYFGGPVISNIQVFTIYWGSSFTKPQADKVENYYKQVVNSSYLDWLVEYNTPSQRIGRGSFIGSYFAKDAPTGNIKQDQVEAFLLSLRSKDLIPKTTADTYYAIHTDRSVSFTTTDGSSCSEFLAAHYSFKDEQGKYVYWAVMPDCGSRYEIWLRILYILICNNVDTILGPFHTSSSKPSLIQPH